MSRFALASGSGKALGVRLASKQKDQFDSASALLSLQRVWSEDTVFVTMPVRVSVA